MEISTHQECNVNLSLTKEISALFHNLQSLKKNLQSYDSHRIFQ